MKLLAVDSNSILNRAFYGIKLLTTKDGQFTNGIYGYFNILLRICEEVQPDAIACAFDLKAPTFRHQMYDGYKAQRKGMPEELAQQLEPLKSLLRDLGYRIVECEGYEADDILGTLASACRERGEECVIATGDRDSLQLVGGGVTVRLATTKMGRPESTFYDEAAIQEKYGVSPKALIQVKALMGDASDNIPGVPGVGEKTALDLIQRFATVDNIYEHLEELDIKPGVRNKLTAGKESAYMSLKLAEICCTVPIETEPSAYQHTEGDPGAAHALMSRLELFKLIEKYQLSPGPSSAQPAQEESVVSRPVLTQQTATLPLLEKALQQDRVPVLFTFQKDEVTALALRDGDTLLIAHPEDPDFSAILEQVASHADKLVTNQSKNLYRWGLAHERDVPIVAFDSQLAAYLLSPTSTDYGNDRLAAEYQIPSDPLPEEVDSLAAQLAFFPALCTTLEEKVEQIQQHRLLYEIEQPLARVLASMEWIGVELDKEGLIRFGELLDVDLATYEANIYAHAGEKFNINSPKQLGVILFDKLELPAKKKTKSGYSTNADVLESLRGMHPIIEDILQYRKLIKLKSTYVDGLLKVVAEDGRVHTSFQQMETRTGRISSIEPNMQNIPVRTEIGSNLRKFFRAKEGCQLADADYSQIELRVLASIAKDETMIGAFRDGVDIHTQTASQVFGMPLEFVTPLMRSRAKAVNFGIVYGIGAFSLSQDIGVSVSEADSYIKNYLSTYHGVRQYMDETKKFAAEQGYVTTLLDRRRALPELSSSNRITRAFGERVAMNTPIQGTAADIIKIAMIRVYDRLRAEHLQAKLVLQVHDELIVETPANELDQVKRLLKEEMEGAIDLAVPMEVEVGTGSTWYEAK